MAKKIESKKLYCWAWGNGSGKSALEQNIDPDTNMIQTSIKAAMADLKRHSLENGEDGTATVYEITVSAVKKIKVIRNDIQLEEVK